MMTKISEEMKTHAGTTESEQDASEIDTALKSEHSARDQESKYESIGSTFMNEEHEHESTLLNHEH